MPVVKVTDTYTEGLPVPAESDIHIKTPPGISFTFEIRSAGRNVLTGILTKGEKLLKKAEFADVQFPVFFIKRFKGIEATVAEVVFI